ncbi:GNAT family N-acetyltransferase [Mesobacillus subterraneus]|uniref:GNAT family N-acetyltransferase n=1 Tax=Mesobacillus subterraneus TaxID=285983 RepID=UPI0020412BCB|nr:GNAT family N-acetyltransferase [Mesobacillus subterraneus]MCM3664837.1 GNAT family N-acetyltransferase [Mesobacillus subterraneus]MCM3681926.1 GNAT family N-acetyltransferase [Mesobacillus subterraneus]
MVKKLVQSDNDRVMEFLKQEPSINLFIIGDIEAFGFDADFQELWGEFHETGEIKAVLLRFHNSFIPYSLNESDLPVTEFADIMKSFSEKIFLSGKSSLVERFEGIEGLNIGPKQVTYFAECISEDSIGVSPFDIKVATMEDVDKILELRRSIEEFIPNPNARKILVESMESRTGRTYFIEQDGKMVASASTAAENSMSAMIVGVCSHKEFRRKGLATAVMQKLFKDVMDEGKILCLFYDNPDAGRIYKRLGFKDIGKWTMHR